MKDITMNGTVDDQIAAVQRILSRQSPDRTAKQRAAEIVALVNEHAAESLRLTLGLNRDERLTFADGLRQISRMADAVSKIG